MDEPARQEGKRALEVAERVIKLVVRAFYDDEVAVVMDGLMILTVHQSMTEQDLATKLKLQHTFVRRCLAQLEKDCLVRSREVKETHGNREQNHQYWWVDHKQALDAIKLRMRRMRKKLEQEPAERKTEYVCETCVDDDDRHPSWDEFEVQELPVPFECPHCQQDLEEKVQSMDDGGGSNDISKRLEKELRPINDEISKTEEMTLPAPRANTAASRVSAKAGEPGHVPGGGGPGADQGPQAKKIVVSLEGLQGKPAWQMQPSAAEAGSGTAAAAISTAGLGSFQALVRKPQNEADQGASAPAQSEPAAAGAAVDAASAEFLRLYQEECRRQQEALNAAETAQASGRHDLEPDAAADDDEDEFMEEEEEVMVLVNGKEIALDAVTEEHQEQMSKEEYESYQLKLQEYE